MSAGPGAEGGNPSSVSSENDPGRRPLPPDLARLLHDVRGPLNSLTLHVKLLESAAMDDATAEAALRTTKEQLARLTEMLPAAFAVVALEAASPLSLIHI